MLGNRIPTRKVMGCERAHAHAQGFLDDGVCLFDSGQSFFDGQCRSLKEAFKDRVHGIAVATLYFDWCLSNEFI